MRLSDLNPKWATDNSLRFAPSIILGVSFLCPCCQNAKLSVPFANPIDRDGLLAMTNWRPPAVAWQREGDTFETLTLTPSVDASPRGHWHGHIIDGEIQ